MIPITSKQWSVSREMNKNKAPSLPPAMAYRPRTCRNLIWFQVWTDRVWTGKQRLQGIATSGQLQVSLAVSTMTMKGAIWLRPICGTTVLHVFAEETDGPGLPPSLWDGTLPMKDSGKIWST